MKRLKALQEELDDTECHILELDVRDRQKVESAFAGLPPGFKDVEKKLANSNIWVSPRVGGLRLSPHFYNNKGEVDVFLEKLKEAT